jgi:formylglycine-generating enzyme required for sulfatase activity
MRKAVVFWMFGPLVLLSLVACEAMKKAKAPASYTETIEGLTVPMVWIPSGRFEMGSRMSAEEVVKKYRGAAGDEQNLADEHPVHEVELDGFWLGKFEVTNRQYRKFQPGHDSGSFQGWGLNSDDQPVVEVSWTDAKAFCDWLSQKTGKTYTLPTEAQWEYACRAGTTTERYWGDDDDQMGKYANTADRTLKRDLGAKVPSSWVFADTTDGYVVSAPVGRFKPNAFGLYDMIGNVWEWCEDWYDEKYYASSPLRNPTGPSVGAQRVLRGGSWGIGPESARSAYRCWFSPEGRVLFFGFRLARSQK